MRAVKSTVLIVGLSLSFAAGMAAQTQLKISRTLPLKNPDNECVSPTFRLNHGQARFKVTSRCSSVTALVCTYRSTTSGWHCEMPPLHSAGQIWLAPFRAEPSSVYYVGACKTGNSNCEDSLQFLYSHIIGRPKNLDPQQVRPPEPCDGTNCSIPPPAPPPPPPAPERG